MSGLLSFFSLTVTLLNHKWRKGFHHLGIIADGAVDDAGRMLLFKGGTVFKPALKKMAIRTDEIVSNHFDTLI